VSGYGKVFFDADICDLVFGVTTEDPDVTTCRASHADRTEGIRDWISRSLSDDAIFAELSTDLRIKYPKNQEPVYIYQTMFSLRTKEIAQLAELQESLVTLGVNSIVNIKLFSERLPELEDKARRLAISDAKAKADLAAAELDWEILGATNIRFDESRWRTQSFSQSYGSRANLTNPSHAAADGAEVFVDASVTVSFTFRQK